MIILADSNKKVITSVGKVISLITIVTLISKFLGLLREVGIASLFGAGTETDAFYVAIVIPSLIFTSFGLALQNLFMAEFANYKEIYQNKTDQSIFISKMVNILFVIAFILYIVSTLGSASIVKIVAPGFDEPYKFSLTVNLTNILLPTLIIIPIYQIKAAVLRVYDKFVSVSIIDLFFNIVQLVYIFLYSDRFGIQGLAFSILLAYSLQLLTINVIMKKMGFKYKFIIDFKDKYIHNIFILFIPTMISFGIIHVNVLVDKIIASNLDNGSVSALNYGFMVRNLAYNIIVLSIITVIYPKLLGYKSKNENKEFNDVAIKIINFFILLLLPLTIIMMTFADSIIKLIFERGNFTHYDTIMTGRVLFYYSIGIIAFSIKEFLIRICYTYKNTKLPLLITLIGSVSNIIFSIILMKFMGVSGIALGLSISELLSMFIFINYIKKLKYLVYTNHLLDLFKIILINVILIILIVLLKPFLYIPNSIVNLGVALIIYVVIYFIAYLLICYLFNVKMIKELIYNTYKKYKRGL